MVQKHILDNPRIKSQASRFVESILWGLLGLRKSEQLPFLTYLAIRHFSELLLCTGFWALWGWGVKESNLSLTNNACHLTMSKQSVGSTFASVSTDHCSLWTGRFLSLWMEPALSISARAALQLQPSAHLRQAACFSQRLQAGKHFKRKAGYDQTLAMIDR